MITPVILAGGNGSCPWPVSRKAAAKQFTQLTGDESLFQATARRLSGAGFTDPTVLTNVESRFVVTHQLDEIGAQAGRVLIEPQGQNTAAAFLAAAMAHADTPHALLLVAPSDHLIRDETAFEVAIQEATRAAQKGALVTFGIHPTRPETGYGYLELESVAAACAVSATPLKSFIEMPRYAAADTMLKDGRFLWDAGVFMFKVSTILDALQTDLHDLLESVNTALAQASDDMCFTRLDPTSWAKLRDVSIDYAAMEQAGNLMVVPVGCEWADMGSWRSIWEDSNEIADDNAVLGVCCDGRAQGKFAPEPLTARQVKHATQCRRCQLIEVRSARISVKPTFCATKMSIPALRKRRWHNPDLDLRRQQRSSISPFSTSAVSVA